MNEEKLHYFFITYRVAILNTNTNITGNKEWVMSKTDKNITCRDLNTAKDDATRDVQSDFRQRYEGVSLSVVSISYLGHMTREHFDPQVK